jgi:hypothetical protein
MKNLIKTITLSIALIIGASVKAQDAKVIKLTQVDGDFKDVKDLKLKAGESYVFEVSNEGVDHSVGFVITPKGMTDQDHHIQNAYVQKMIADGETSSSKEVVFEKGEYEFFCPMNPTPHYKITVN